MVCHNESSAQVLPPKIQRLDHHWYSDVILFSKTLTCPEHIKGHKRRSLRLKSIRYWKTQEGLRWRNIDGIILRCVNEQESKQIFEEFHSGFCGRNYVANTIAHKILREGYYWPSIFAYVHNFFRSCQQCQLFTGKQRLAASCGVIPFSTLGAWFHWTIQRQLKQWVFLDPNWNWLFY